MNARNRSGSSRRISTLSLRSSLVFGWSVISSTMASARSNCPSAKYTQTIISASADFTCPAGTRSRQVIIFLRQAHCRLDVVVIPRVLELEDDHVNDAIGAIGLPSRYFKKRAGARGALSSKIKLTLLCRDVRRLAPVGHAVGT